MTSRKLTNSATLPLGCVLTPGKKVTARLASHDVGIGARFTAPEPEPGLRL